jgi:O-antigen/teichoic acid export membrane protein
MTTVSVKKKAIRGAAWTIIGYGINQILRFGSNLILTRLLVPEYFGLMAIVNTLLMGIELFSDVGIGQSIIQNKHGEETEFLNTAWTLQIYRGFLVWLLCLAITFPAASIYKEPRLLWILPIMGFTSIILGFASTAPALLNRKMDLGKLTIFDVIVQLLSLVTLVGLAFYFRNIYALVIGGLAGASIRAIGSHFLLPGKPNRFAWNRASLNEMVSFGRWIFIATALMFVAEQADRLILGKLFSLQMLGVYSIAATLANMPREVIKHLSYRVIFPTISHQVDLPRATLRAKIIRQRGLIIIGFALGLAALVSVGDLLIARLYDQRYVEAIWMMPILCSGIWFSVLFYTTSPALLAVGKPLYSAQSNFVRFVSISIGLPIAFYYEGSLGAIIAIAFSDFPLYLANLYGLWREKLLCLVQDIQGTALFIGTLILFVMIRYSLGFGTPFPKFF